MTPIASSSPYGPDWVEGISAPRSCRAPHVRTIRCFIRAAALLSLVGIVCLGAVALAAREYVSCPLLGHARVTLSALGTDASGVRADLIYQVFMGPKAQRIAIIQLPRDGRVYADGRTRKLNSMMGLGASKLCGMVGELTDAGPDRHIVLTFQSAVAVLQALCPNGIEVDNPCSLDFTFSRSEGAYRLQVPKGSVKVSPQDFFLICRLRQSLKDVGKKDGDVAARQPRQAQMLRFLLRQIVHDKDLRMPLRLRQVVREKLDTDLTERELMGLAWAFHRMRSQDLRIVPAPGSPCRGGLWAIDTDRLHVLSDALKAWSEGRSLVDLTIRTCPGTNDIGSIADAIKASGHTVQVRTIVLRQPLPRSWVAYSDGLSPEDVATNRDVAVAIAKELHLSAPHRERNGFGVTVAVGNDLHTQRGGK